MYRSRRKGNAWKMAKKGGPLNISGSEERGHNNFFEFYKYIPPPHALYDYSLNTSKLHLFSCFKNMRNWSLIFHFQLHNTVLPFGLDRCNFIKSWEKISGRIIKMYSLQIDSNSSQYDLASFVNIHNIVQLKSRINSMIWNEYFNGIYFRWN